MTDPFCNIFKVVLCGSLCKSMLSSLTPFACRKRIDSGLAARSAATLCLVEISAERRLPKPVTRVDMDGVTEGLPFASIDVLEVTFAILIQKITSPN